MVEKSLFENQSIENKSVFIVSAFEHEKECQMREYLLKPHKRIGILKNNAGKIYIIPGQLGIQGLSNIISDKLFAFIHLKYSSNTLFRTLSLEDFKQELQSDHREVIEFIEESDVQLTLAFRKTKTSVKSILECY